LPVSSCVLNFSFNPIFCFNYHGDAVHVEALFLKLCRLDGARHDEEKSERLIFEAYAKTNHEVGFGTIIYLAREKGLNINSKDGSSNQGS
jgi:hypothetical protein